MGGITWKDAWRKGKNLEKEKETCKVLDGQYIVHALQGNCNWYSRSKEYISEWIPRSVCKMSTNNGCIRWWDKSLGWITYKQWHWHLRMRKDGNWSNIEENYGSHLEELAQTIRIQARSIVSKMFSKHHWEKVRVERTNQSSTQVECFDYIS